MYVDRILRGTKPEDLPVERPTVNFKIDVAIVVQDSFSDAG
jgi:hypothetical protein